MKATIKIVPPTPIEDTVTLTLTMTRTEASRLMAVVGHIVGAGNTRELTDQIYNLLARNGILPFPDAISTSMRINDV